MAPEIQTALLGLLDNMETAGEDSGTVRFMVGAIEWKIQASISNGSTLDIRIRPRTRFDDVDLGDLE